MKQAKKWVCELLVILFFTIVGSALLVIVIDPYFHFHAPINDSYYWGNERYTNPGIVDNFDYDMMIAGSSMTQNFRPSEIEEKNGLKCIKVPLAAANYKEANYLVERAINKNANLKMVIRGLDYNKIIDRCDIDSDERLPEYLYDEEYRNDIQYVLNRQAVERSLLNVYMMIMNKNGTNFDVYSSWNKEAGVDVVLSAYERPSKNEIVEKLSENEKQIVIDNIEMNVVKIAKDNPNVQFYYFLTPFSILYWDNLQRTGTMEKQFQAEKIAIEHMLGCSNIHLYSFNDEIELVENLNNYVDIIHYTPQINSYILKGLYSEEHRITEDNYMDYLEKERLIYTQYDYDEMWTSFMTVGNTRSLL